MSGVLLIFAVLSIGAVAVATYVFTVAARNYVSDPTADAEQHNDQRHEERVFVERSAQDRRQTNNVIQFPITLSNGEVVLQDRRAGERRAAS